MPAAIAPKLLEQLRNALFDYTEESTLDMVLNDAGEKVIVGKITHNSGYDARCGDLIRWAENGGKLKLLCTGLQRHENTKGNVFVQKAVSAIITALEAPVGVSTASDGRVIMLKRRPFLNRDKLWSILQSFETQQGIDRLLVIAGEQATGKSYSEYLLGHVAETAGATFVSLEVPPSAGELTAASLAEAISERLGSDAPLRRFDDLGQEARAGKWYGDKLVGKLSMIAKPTWMVIDGFNEVDLAQSAVDFLIRLCRAIELELKQHWLVLVGLDPAKLGSEYESLVRSDIASGPASKHVTEFINIFASSVGRTLDQAEVDRAAVELCGALGSKPTHESWRSFHRLLCERCRAIQEERPG